MFGFRNKNTENIQRESAKIDSMINYLSNEIDSSFDRMVQRIENEEDKLLVIKNRIDIIEGYGDMGNRKLQSLKEDIQVKFLQFFQSKAGNFQDKMTRMIGSCIILLVLRTGSTMDTDIIIYHMEEILSELTVAYDSQ